MRTPPPDAWPPALPPKARRPPLPDPAHAFVRDVAFGMLSVAHEGRHRFLNPNPILRKLSPDGRMTYRRMENDPAIAAAKSRRIETLLQRGWSIEAGRSGTQDAADLRDWVEHASAQCSNWHQVPRMALDAIFHGWQPLEIIWTHTTWQERDLLTIDRVIGHAPEDYGWTPESSLVYVGGEAAPNGDRDPADRHWMICIAGDSGSFYGEAVLQSVWPLWFIKQHAQALAIHGPTLTGSAQDHSAMLTAELRATLTQAAMPRPSAEMFYWIFGQLNELARIDGGTQSMRLLDALIRIAITHEPWPLAGPSAGGAATDGLAALCHSDGLQLEGWINKQLIRPLVELNFGQVDKADLPRWRVW